MNHRQPTSASTGVGQALPCLALLLIPLLTADSAWSRPVSSYLQSAVEATPYLVVIGSPDLRFLEAMPPPDLVTRPPAAAPPQAANEPAAPAKPDVIPFTPAGASASATPESGAPVSNAETAPIRVPAPILPDELRPRVRAEDFLPYFEIPGAKPGDPSVIVPVPRGTAVPATLPPSSATYTQSPR